MASESPWRASAVPRHRVAQGRLDGDGNEVDVGGLGACFPIQAATDCCDAPAVSKAIQGVLAQARVARLGVGERRRQRAQRLRRSSPRHHVPNLVQEQLYPQIILCVRGYPFDCPALLVSVEALRLPPRLVGGR